jgi:hypothetical protein
MWPHPSYLAFPLQEKFYPTGRTQYSHTSDMIDRLRFEFSRAPTGCTRPGNGETVNMIAHLTAGFENQFGFGLSITLQVTLSAGCGVLLSGCFNTSIIKFALPRQFIMQKRGFRVIGTRPFHIGPVSRPQPCA